jgi:exosortase
MTRSNVLTGPSPAAPTNSKTNLELPRQSRFTSLWIVLMAAALAALFRVNLVRLWQVTNPISGDPSWGHAIYLPFISLFYLNTRKPQIAGLRPTPTRWGLSVLLGGIALFAYGICMASIFPALSSFVQDAGMIAALYGTVLSLFGWPIAKWALFPVGYLLCGIPWPPTLIDITTAPLQHLAATASIWILAFSPLNVEQVGNTIHVLAASGPDRVLEVAEACSGLRSIAVFIAIGLAVAFLPARALWKSIVIGLCAVPIAISCNVMRIVGDVLLDHYVSHRLSEGFYHSFTGVVLLVPGVFLFLLVGRALDWVVPDPEGKKYERPTSNVQHPTSNEKQDIRASYFDVGSSHLPGSKVELLTSCVAGDTPAMRRTIEPARGVRRMYVTVLSIVTIAALTFGVATHVLQLHFQKSPVPLPMPLTALPADIGPWRWVGSDHPLDADIQAMLGTDQYIYRTYLDERLVGPDQIEQLRHRSDGETAAGEISADHPSASVHLSLTYYTGRVDSVSHIPERCYVGGGEASSTRSVQKTWNINGQPTDVRLVTIDNPQAKPGAIRYVAYCYRVNGRPESESWRVRRSLINVFERYAWYAKIEVATPVADADQAAKVLTDFLSNALPEIQSRLPNNIVAH